MYTAKIKSKTPENGLVLVEVEFTNGATTVTESIKPASYENLKDMVRSRLNALNSAAEIDARPIDEEIETAIARTQEEIDRDKWLVAYNKWTKVKKNLIDTNILIGNEPAVTALQTKVKNGLKAEYLDFI